MAGLPASSTASRTACSSRLSTRGMVDTTCWASTARQSVSANGLRSDATAGGVQVVNDTNQAFGSADQFERLAAQREIVIGEPKPGLVAMTEDGIERAEQPYEQHAELPFLAMRIQHIVPGCHARDGRGADAEDAGDDSLADAEKSGGAHDRLGQGGARVGTAARRLLRDLPRLHRLAPVS